MKPPSHLSLPRASALPVLKMGFSYTAKQRLLGNGIVSALQLAEIASRAPHQLKRLSGISATKACRVLEQELGGSLPDFSDVAVSHDRIPAPGVPLAHPPAAPETSFAIQQTAKDRLQVRLEEIGPLPSRTSLTANMQPVGNQGPFPTCTGWASTAAWEYSLACPMSPGYAYRGAKSRDGVSAGGSWLFFAMEHFFQTGHVSPRDYPYTAAIREDPIDILDQIAARARTIGHTNLLPAADMETFPHLMRCILAGRLNPAIGPKPIAVSLVLRPSFVSTSTALDGLIPLPRPDETRRSGHAMCVVGYIDKDDPENPFGISYFLVRNSWGKTWAQENPFGEPGHAMIPESYFETKENVLEAYVCLGGKR